MCVRPRKVDRGIEGWSALDYDQQVITAVNAFKEHGRSALLADFCGMLDSIDIPAEVVLVGLPSSAKSTRVRGFVPGELLAQRLARRRGMTSVCALTIQRSVQDQSSLSRIEREANLRGSMQARPVRGQIWLVDDVVTTGSSLREAQRAMRQAGNTVTGFITIAETILKFDA